jgi:hypothetical protein
MIELAPSLSPPTAFSLAEFQSDCALGLNAA